MALRTCLGFFCSAAIAACFVFSFVALLAPFPTVGGNSSDGITLKKFMVSADLQGKLASNWTGEDPCLNSWHGVSCSADGEVTVLILDFMRLGGSIPESTLSQLHRLTVLSLNANDFTDTIPADITNCTDLTHLYLANNNLSGPIPTNLSKIIERLDLSNNALSGSIPPSLANLSLLASLHLHNNLLSGNIPEFRQGTLTDLNISNNGLSGPIPPTETLKRFKHDSFFGNALLCGDPMPSCNRLHSGNVIIKQQNRSNNTSTTSEKKSNVLGTSIVIKIVIGDVVALVLISVLCVFCCKRREGKMEQDKIFSKIAPEKRIRKFGSPRVSESSNNSTSTRSIASYTFSAVSAKEQYNPQLVTFEGQTFKLEDLLRASAEFVGKGSLGAVYKATMGDGTAAAVKRLRNSGISIGMHEFFRKIEIVGRLRHPNVVPMWAYYYGKDKKILVYEYEPYGNLFTLLHGFQSVSDDREHPFPSFSSAGHKPLSWSNRVRVARGVANGLAFLHQQKEKEPHGNIKTTNILINRSFEACIGDFGLAYLINSSIAESQMVGYRAPEFEHGRKITQKADVYSFGVLLLELLTGRMPDYYSTTISVNLPKWVNLAVRQEWTTEIFDPSVTGNQNDEALVSLLKIAMACVAPGPDSRPTMTEVAMMIMEDVPDQEEPEFSNYCSSLGSYTPKYSASPMSSVLMASP